MLGYRKAFTLTELLVALGIIGAIAALAIPSLLNNINNRMLATQLKSFVGSVQQLVNEQKSTYKTQNLTHTDFSKGAANVLSSTNFEIAKSCATPAKDCWKTSDEADTKVSYRKLSDLSSQAIEDSKTTVLLKNGAIISYEVLNSATEPDLIGAFYIDVNGNDAPNVIGRDYFSFYVSKTGAISYAKPGTDATTDIETLTSDCEGGSAFNCFGAVQLNTWKMPY